MIFLLPDMKGHITTNKQLEEEGRIGLGHLNYN